MKKIMIVNDCRLEGRILKDTITSLGYAAQISDEFTVYNEIKEFEPDIVIANLLMESMRGDQLIENIKEKNANIKGVLSSCSEIKLADYRNKGVDYVLKTPVNTKVLGSLLEEICRTIDEAGCEVKNGNNIGEIVNNVVGFNFCHHCGKKIDDSFKYCPFCGKDLMF